MPQPHQRTPLPPLRLMLLAVFTLALAGCFHSDDDPAPVPVPDANPTGYYTNSGFVDVKAGDNSTQRLVQNIQGMVHNGQLMLLGDAEHLTYVGTFTVTGNDLSGTVTVYEADVMVQKDVPLSGVITEGSKITGTLGGSGVANGTFQLDYATDNGPVDMAMVARLLSWEPVAQSPPDIPFLSVSDIAVPIPNVGTATSGNNIFEGCNFNGRMEPIAGTHLYTVSVTMDNCNGMGTGVDTIPTYTGLISVRGTDRLILVLTNGAYDFSGEYKEQ
ncbi:MAG: hypothetical protein COB71_11030 [Thiotrichales bacterium]|nr:MAG: hypothetical protein COB71_11030 [Thiotrichales bacterium]